MSQLIPAEIIENRILLMRGCKVMLSSTLADLYGVEHRALIQAVQRNRDRFPDDFMFQLTKEEFRLLINKRTDEYPTDNVVILQDEKGLDYIELRFVSEFAELKLKKVTKGSKCSSELFSKIEEIVNNKDLYPDEIEIEK